MKVLMSIKPKYAEKIFNGEKIYEFRRKIWKDSNVYQIVLYATAPVSKVVGVMEIGDIYYDKPETLWEGCKHGAGISREAFFKYFSGVEYGNAISRRTVWRFITPAPLSDYGIVKPPQNFMYLKDTNANTILRT
jgi:predicted transcriptional regulator